MAIKRDIIALLLISLTLLACIRCDILAQMDEANLIPPRIIDRAPLYYPEELQDELIMGRVTLEVTILQDGSIGYIEIESSIPELDSLAIYNVTQWLFEPAYLDDEPTIGTLEIDIDFIPDMYEFEVAPPDTIAIDLEKLQDKIDRFILKRQEPLKHTLSLLDFPGYSENYHIISWERGSPLMEKNRFTIIPSMTLEAHTFQNYYPLYRTEIETHNWNFDTEEYLLPATFVVAYAGLGFLNMDYAHIRVAKNNSLDIENLQFHAGLLFQDGYWIGTPEKSSNFNLGLIYPIGDNTLYWNTFYLDQEIPVIKFRDEYLYQANVFYEEKNIEHSLYWENRYLDLGLKYEKREYDSTLHEIQPERTLYQIMLSRTLKWREHNLNLNWQYFEIDATESFENPYITDNHRDIRRIGYDYQGETLQISGNLLSGMGYEYYANLGARYRINDILRGGITLLEASPRQAIRRSVSTLTTRDLKASIGIETGLGSFDTGFGYREYKQYGDTYHYHGSFLLDDIPDRALNPEIGMETPYISANYGIRFGYRVTDWKLSTTLHAHLRDELDYFPQYHGKANLECRYNLRHNNAITAGLIYHHAAQFYTPYQRVDATDMLDGYIRISITRLFDFQADAKNLLESESLYGFPTAGIHWNVGIRWYFFN